MSTELDERIAKAREDLRAASEGRWAEGCLTEHQLDWRAGMFAAGLRLARLLEERDSIGKNTFEEMSMEEELDIKRESARRFFLQVVDLRQEIASLKRQLAEEKKQHVFRDGAVEMSFHLEQLAKAIATARADAIEACAKVCDKRMGLWPDLKSPDVFISSEIRNVSGLIRAMKDGGK